MVSEHDRALVEAKARGLSEQDVMAATAHPWRQILKWDLVGSAVGISVFLLLYYAASAFFTIYWATVFKNPNGLNLSTAQANSLNTWFWWADIVALIVFGDPLRPAEGAQAADAGRRDRLDRDAGLLHPRAPTTRTPRLDTRSSSSRSCWPSFISLTYAPWMAGYTEMVEAKNPALVGTGLALWGWILRLTVGLSFIFLPLVVTSVNPVVDNLQYAQTTVNGQPFNAQQFQIDHPESVAFAEANASWLKVLQEPQRRPDRGRAQRQPDRRPTSPPSRRRSPAFVFAKTVANADHAQDAGRPLRGPARLPGRPPEPADRAC